MDPETEKKLKVLTAITAIHRSVGANLDLREAAEILVRELRNIVDCQGCAVLLIEGDRVDVLAECGFLESLERSELAASTPAVGYILGTKRSLVAGNGAESPAAACIPTGCGMRSLVCAPILVGGEVRGIVHLDSPKVDAFGESDISFIELLTSEVAIVFERSLAYGRLMDISQRDGLTGCLNRRRFDQDLVCEAEGAQRAGIPLALLMLDLDRFKWYNDRFGHQQGDELLRGLVATLQGRLRSRDRLYRYGGEEFAVLLPDTPVRGALGVAERLRLAVEDGRLGAGDSAVTVSGGVASFDAAGGAAKLVADADEALYRAKREGRNRVRQAPGADGSR